MMNKLIECCGSDELMDINQMINDIVEDVGRLLVNVPVMTATGEANEFTRKRVITGVTVVWDLLKPLGLAVSCEIEKRFPGIEI